MSDFVTIIGQLTDFVQNERTSSFNEGVDMMLKSAKDWARLLDLDPHGDNMPDLLDDILNQINRRHGAVSTPPNPETK